MQKNGTTSAGNDFGNGRGNWARTNDLRLENSLGDVRSGTNGFGLDTGFKIDRLRV